MTQAVDWWAIAAPLCLVSAAVFALLVDTFAPRGGVRGVPCAVAVVGIGAASAVTVALWDAPRAAFCLPARFEQPVDCSWVVDEVTVVWWVVVLLATGLVALLLAPPVDAGELPGGETYFLLLSSAAGALAVAAAHDLITLVVAMETVSLPSFALVGLRRRDRRGAEAAVKFFIVSVVSTAVSLLGISVVYGATGSVAAGAVATMATDSAVRPLVAVGMVLTLVGLGFKLAVVPFQMWVPDTYVGAPIPVAAYLSVVSKVAGLAGTTIVVVRFLPSYVDTWAPMLAVAAALTMTVGNLAALRQRHAVRLLAWSSVAQAGFLLVPLGAGGEPVDVGAIQVYAAMYMLVNLGAFGVVAAAASAAGAVEVADFSGLARRAPMLGLPLAFALLCLAGLPPGVVGLVAKVVIFQSAVDGGLTWLAAVMAVNVAIGLVYYLRFIATLFVEPSANPVEPSVDPVEPSADPVEPQIRPLEPSVRAAPEKSRTATVLPVPAPIRFVVAASTVAAISLSVWPGPLFAILH